MSHKLPLSIVLKLRVTAMERFTNYLQVAAIIIATVHPIRGHLYFGSCPELLPAENFTVSDIKGTWYEVEALGAFLEGRFTKCNSPTFIQRSENKFNVEYSRVAWPTGRMVSRGFGKVEEGGKLELSFPLPGVGMQRFQYHILAIEKDKYAVAWSCTQLPLVHLQKAWILSRNRTLDEDTLSKVHDFVEFNGLNRNYFMKVKQSSCPTEETEIKDEGNSVQIDVDGDDLALQNNYLGTF